VEGLVANTGTSAAAAAVRGLAFFDANDDSVLDPMLDTALGSALTSDQIPVDVSLTLEVPVAGILPYRGAPLSLWVDSDENIAELDEENNQLGVAGYQCRKPTVHKTYTLNADFDEGEGINVVTDVPDQLQLDDTARAVPFIWIPASGRGTILKLDIDTGEILGEYLSSPNGRGRNPSRTTVDKGGNVWAGNRAEAGGGRGSVVQHVGWVERSETHQ